MCLPDRPRRVALLLLIGVAAAVRLPGLDRVPPPLNQDEASRGYDAWCLLETGADRHGARWPWFLESFGPGDFTAALSTYLMLPSIAALGPSVLGMRLPNAIFGVATVALLYLALRRRMGDVPSLVASGVLALDPWHVALSRTAHEAAMAPVLLAAAMLAFERADAAPLIPERRAARRCAWVAAAGLLLASHAWVYPATRLFTPLLVAVVGCCFASTLRDLLRSRGGRSALVSLAAGIAVGGWPIWAAALGAPRQLAARMSAVLLDGNEGGAFDWLGRFVANFIRHYDPAYLFLRCDEMSGASIPGVGLHLVVLAPLLLLGVGTIAAEARQSRWARFLIAWLILYPLPAAICGDWNPHPLRSVGGVLLFPIIAAVGAQTAGRRIGSFRANVRRGVFQAGIVLLLCNAAYFADAYFRRFPPLASAGYQTPLVEAIWFAARHEPPAEFILVTNVSNQPYIYSLLAEPVAPRDLPATPRLSAAGPRGFDQVLRVGRFWFAPREIADHPEARTCFEAAWAEVPVGARGLVVEIPGRIVEGQTLAVFGESPPRGPGWGYEVRAWVKTGPAGAGSAISQPAPPPLGPRERAGGIRR